MAYNLSRRSLSRLQGVDSLLIAIAVDAIKESPYDFGIPRYGGLRSESEQHLLYNQQLSQRDGYNLKSYHQSGKAFDIYVIVDGKPSWDTKYYKPVADHIMKVAMDNYSVKLTWGGQWKHFVDMPHFQI